MSIANLIRRPDHLSFTERGSKLSKEQVENLEKMREDAEYGIQEAVAGLKAIAGYIYHLNESDRDNREGFNTASWSVNWLAETICALKLTISDCYFHRIDGEPGVAAVDTAGINGFVPKAS